jgi:hypothetical protein
LPGGPLGYCGIDFHHYFFTGFASRFCGKRSAIPLCRASYFLPVICASSSGLLLIDLAPALFLAVQMLSSYLAHA